MNLRDAMRKAASLIVEGDGAPTPTNSDSPPNVDDLLSVLDGQPGTTTGRTVDDLVRDSDGPNLDDIAQGAHAAPAVAVPVRADGSVDFPAIYASLGVPQSPFGAEQMLEVLASLPVELPLETRRATVKVTLGALSRAAGGASAAGATPDAIVADASRKVAALHASVQKAERAVGEAQTQTEREVAELQRQVEALRTALQKRKTESETLKTACEHEADRLDDVLEFFSLDVAPSKYAQKN